MRSWKHGFLSISPLEFVSILAAARVALENVKHPELNERKPGAWIIARSDNAAVCFVSRRHLSTKPTMAACVELQTEMEEA